MPKIHYQCNDCEYICKTEEAWKEHSRDHINQLGLYKCDHCNYNSKRKFDIKEHVRQLHKLEMQNENTCQPCGKSFNDEMELTDHSAFDHGPFYCHICENYFHSEKERRHHINNFHVHEATRSCSNRRGRQPSNWWSRSGLQPSSRETQQLGGWASRAGQQQQSSW